MSRAAEDRLRVLAIGGFEPTGRMGLLADLTTIAAMGAQPVGVASAVTAQGTRTFGMDPVPARVVAKQIRAARELGPVHAVKVGMIPDRATLNAIRWALADLRVPCVVDPVVRTSSGNALSSLSARDYRLLALPQVVITPNVPEAAWLLGIDVAEAEADLEDAAFEVLRLGFGGVALKGGHRKDAAVDLIAEAGRVKAIRGQLVKRGPEKRGTGCRYGAALAVELARGEPLLGAARTAKRRVLRYLSN